MAPWPPSAFAYGHHDRKCSIFQVISLGCKVHLSVSARGPRMRPAGRSLPTPGLVEMFKNRKTCTNPKTSFFIEKDIKTTKLCSKITNKL